MARWATSFSGSFPASAWAWPVSAPPMRGAAKGSSNTRHQLEPTMSRLPSLGALPGGRRLQRFFAPTSLPDKCPHREERTCGAGGFARWSRLQAANFGTSGLEEEMAGEIEARLKALDLVLPEVPSPVADYVSFLHLNNQLYIAGQLPLKQGKIAVAGTLGADLDIDQGQDAARICALNILAQAKTALGDLDRIVQCLRLNGYVNAVPGFTDHPKVINAASGLMVKVLGQKGRHTRAAVGCSSLP